MAALERIEACGISISECTMLDELEEMSEEERQEKLLPVERMFDELEAIRLPEFFEKLFRSGCPIYQRKIKTAFEIGTRVRVCYAGGSFFALVDVVESEEGSAVKSVKIFELK